jgi:hypothetical protein
MESPGFGSCDMMDMMDFVTDVIVVATRERWAT